ncbi:MAG: hypothetical protein V1749_11550 [Candidatus Desantisbacteria bacterium]
MLFIDTETDMVNTLQYINDYTKDIGVENIDIDTRKVYAVIMGAKQDGHYPTGGANRASVFRKLASFISYFVAERPIINAFPVNKIGEKLHCISNHQNAIIALEIANSSLKDAQIYRSDGMFLLTNEIKLSDHSYVDIIDALTGVTPSIGMKLVAVLLEQMAYRQNPDCEY